MKKAYKTIIIILILVLFGCSNYADDSNNTFNVNNSDIVERNSENIQLANKIDDIETNVEFNIIDTEQTEETSQLSFSSELEIHFIDVGQGDSALIMCDGEYLLIDGGPSSASSLLYSYLKKLNITYLDYVICSHPDEDHVGGISGALNYASLGVAYSPCSKDTRAYKSFVKYTNSNGVDIQMPNVGDSFKLGQANVEILACNIGSDNDVSIVTKITYGDNTFLFMGDAGTVVEDYLINNNIDIKCDVLKVAHHGSKYSTGYQFLFLAEPKYAVISVGKDNSYGHPTEEVLSKLRDADVKTYRTDMQGDIICISDGSNITFSTEKNIDTDTYKEVGQNSIQRNEATLETNSPSFDDLNVGSTDYKYCININTKKFHYSYCSSVSDMKESNKKYTNEYRDSIVAQGYIPCKRCNP